MSERTGTEVVKVGTAPDFLANLNEVDTSLENVSQYRILPRISIIQGTTPQEKRVGFELGDVILTPGNGLLMKPGQSLLFVPLFNCTQFVAYWDRKDRTQQNGPIKEKTFDPTSILARKARDPEHRSEPYGGLDKNGAPNYYINNVEQNQFAVFIYSGPMRGVIAMLNFAKGEFFRGQAFASSVMQRRANDRLVPLWAQVHSMSCNIHKNKRGNEWFGIDTGNPPVGVSPFITDQEAPIFKKEFEKLKEDFTKGILDSDEGLGQAADPVVPDDGTM